MKRGGGGGVIRVMHLGDCHFEDKYYLELPERRRLLDESRETAFAAALDLALSEGVDLFVMAGDIFDGDRRVGLRVRSMLENALTALKNANIEVVWMTGNHDSAEYLQSQGIRELLKSRGVYLFEGAPLEIKLISKDGDRYTVVGSGHERKGLAENRAALYPVKSGDETVIGLLHGSVQGSADADALYFPCTKVDLAKLGYDLICLGHLHAPGKIDSETFQAYYAGSLMGLSSKESGPHGVFLHTLSHKTVKSRFIALSPLEWHSKRLQVSSDMTLEQVFDKAKQYSDGFRMVDSKAAFDTGMVALKSHGEQRKKIILTLTISGVNDPFLNAFRYDAEALSERLKQVSEVEEIEIKIDLMPERLVELSRTGDSFLGHLTECVQNEDFMKRVVSRFAARALAPVSEVIFENTQVNVVSLDSEAEAVSFAEPVDRERIAEALRDLWPRWMGRSDE